MVDCCKLAFDLAVLRQRRQLTQQPYGKHNINGLFPEEALIGGSDDLLSGLPNMVIIFGFNLKEQ